MFVRHRLNRDLGFGRRIDEESSADRWVVHFVVGKRRFPVSELEIVPDGQISAEQQNRIGLAERRSQAPKHPDSVRDALIAGGVAQVFHAAPLHYVPLILQSGALLSKNALRAHGYLTSHFRRSSWSTDEKRGFAGVVHLMAFLEFELLDAKLGQGFPHVCFSIPTEHLPAHGVLVCRYNIARNHGTFSESSEHGFRREPFMIPVGVSAGEATSILRDCSARQWCLGSARSRLRAHSSRDKD